MADARGCGTIQAILQVLGLRYFRELVATPSLLSKVIEFKGQDTDILSIKNKVQSDTGDEGWAIHTDGSLRYRG